MQPRADLTLFAHVACRPDDQIDLGQAALLIAEAEYADLDLARWIGVLDELGETARLRIADVDTRGRTRDATPALGAVLSYLYGELGFHGNRDDYYDPRNSFLSDVLERRTGLPISLAVVLIEVARRAGLTVHGVSFPGHFLVRAAGAERPLFVDPFTGERLDTAALRALNARHTGNDSDPDPRLLEPAPRRQILARMLGNLRGIYVDRGDTARLRGVLERLYLLAPSEELARQLASLGGEAPGPPVGSRTRN